MFKVKVASEEFGVAPVVAYHHESENSTLADAFSLDLFTDSQFGSYSKIQPNSDLLIGRDIYAQISWDVREPGSKVRFLYQNRSILLSNFEEII